MQRRANYPSRIDEVVGIYCRKSFELLESSDSSESREIVGFLHRRVRSPYRKRVEPRSCHTDVNPRFPLQGLSLPPLPSSTLSCIILRLSQLRHDGDTSLSVLFVQCTDLFMFWILGTNDIKSTFPPHD